jgi:peptidoglycan hydrolase-like protein with peptidoglycan-binding domain
VLSPLAAAQEPLPVAPILRRKSRGDLVVWAQQHLLAAGERVSVNGVYDTRTVRAVKAYQRASALPATGVLDATTWQSLLALPPAKVRWRFAAGGTTASAAAAGRRTGPASAWLPARAREIPPKQH